MQPQQPTPPPILIETDNYDRFGSRAADHVHTMLSYWDREGICRFANGPYLARFGLSKQQLVNVLTKRELLGDDLFEKNLPHINAALNGKQQLFERKEVNRDAGVHYSITAYFPDTYKKKVVGYFVQITDTTPVKALEVKIRDLEKVKERELIRSIIETQELERELIAFQLKESVNQTLAYCKLILEKSREKQKRNTLLENFSSYIHQAIDELNALSTQMSPSIIKLLGFVTGISEYIRVVEEKHQMKIDFECTGNMEEMAGNDKIALFRIIQNYLGTFINNGVHCNLFIVVDYLQPTVKMTLIHSNTDFELDMTSKEFADILNRVEYYHGGVSQSVQFGLSILRLELTDIP